MVVKTLKRKRLEIPAVVSNRPVTNRGVHLQPFGYHGFWMDREMAESYWTNLLKSMGISWVVMLTESDSVLEDRNGTNPLKVWLDAGIIPIIRDKQAFPYGFGNLETVRRTVELYAQYGLRPFWQLYNEPFDPREWKNEEVPAYDEAWQIIASRWSQGARQIVDAGAYVGFPDGPCYAENPYERLRPVGGLEPFERGMAFYAPHNYGLGRPLWYPYDAVTRHAAPLTEEAYRRLLDDYADYPNWYDVPVEQINEQRRTWADPTRTAIGDDTCWRGWEKIVHWSLESLGYVPPMAMTEGGWTPRARAGTMPVDNRWSYPTPKMVARKTVQMYDTPSPFFAICPWLLATDDMGGTGWFDDAWHGGAFTDKYERQKPVIKVLIETPPKETDPRTAPLIIDLDGDTRDWAWVQQAYGAKYQRGTSNLRLIEIHEYEGPGTLDVVVVDGDGLPVEGVPFFYHYPGAPKIGEGEWYKRGILKSTGPYGRVSFQAEGGPCAPGECQGAIWPQGKGDLLQGLGLLSGTRHRHLNGVWQLLEDGAPSTEIGASESGTQPSSETGSGDGEGSEGESGSATESGTGEESEGEPGAETSAGWTMTVEYRLGTHVILGSLPHAGIELTVTDPWGNASTVKSGSKVEHGPGGFEVLAPHLVTYTITFLDQTFEVQMKDGITAVTFTEGESAGPGTEPGTGPGSGSPPEPGGGPGTEPIPEGGQRMNKLGFYVEVTAGIPGLVEAIRDVKPPTLLTHANDRGLLQAIRRDLSPDTFVVGRLHLDVHDQNVWLAGDGERAGRGEWLDCDAAKNNGRALADRVLAHDFHMATERYPNEPGGRLLIDAWMSLNECLPGPMSPDWQKGTEEDRAKLKAKAKAVDCFQVGFHERLQEKGLEAVAFNFGAGNFQKAEHYLDWLPRTLETYTYLGFHEYGWPTLYPDEARGSESAAGLYRACIAGIQEAFPGREYKVIITEAGLARMYKHDTCPERYDDKCDLGWLYEEGPISQDDYGESLRWYNEHLGADDYVMGACLFNVGPSGLWTTFRHLGADNDGQPIGIIGRIKGLSAPRAVARVARPASVTLEGVVTSKGRPIRGAEVRLLGSPHTLGIDPRAVIYDPTAITWTRSITGFEGSLWNGWQKFVAREVAGITYEEFKAQVVQYNPSLAEDRGRFQANQTYVVPRSGATFDGPGGEPEVVWDRQLTGFSGTLWACWRKYVQGKVVGLTWDEFKNEVAEQNEQLGEDGSNFVAGKEYLLPRNAGQYTYARVEYTNSRGRCRFAGLPPGRYDVEVRADGYRLLRTSAEAHADTTLDLELKAIPLAVTKAPGAWVGVRDTDFVVQGKTFRFIGVNLRGLAHYGTPTFASRGWPASKEDRRRQLEEAQRMGARVIRLFLAAADASKEEVGDRLESLLGLIRQSFPDMYLLPALTNLYSDNPFHPQGDDDFFEKQPDGWTILGARWYVDGYTQNYLPFVEHIVRRFRDEPRIFAWEIGNELKATGKPRDFIDFNLAVARRIRTLDPRHPITTGLLSTCHAGIFPPGKRRLYGSDDIDFVTNHLYDFGCKEDPNDVCLGSEDSQLAAELKMPWIVEEAGFQGRPGDDRSSLIDEDMKRWFRRKACGYMQWGFMAGGQDNGDGDDKHGMDNQQGWHTDWHRLFDAYRRQAEELRKPQPV